jgi:hypothetical protein
MSVLGTPYREFERQFGGKTVLANVNGRLKNHILKLKGGRAVDQTFEVPFFRILFRLLKAFFVSFCPFSPKNYFCFHSLALRALEI